MCGTYKLQHSLEFAFRQLRPPPQCCIRWEWHLWHLWHLQPERFQQFFYNVVLQLFYNVLHLKLCFFLHWLIEPCLIFSEALQSQALSESPKHHVLEAVVQEAISVTTCIILQEFCSANLCIMSSQAKESQGSHQTAATRHPIAETFGETVSWIHLTAVYLYYLVLMFLNVSDTCLICLIMSGKICTQGHKWHQWCIAGMLMGLKSQRSRKVSKYSFNLFWNIRWPHLPGSPVLEGTIFAYGTQNATKLVAINHFQAWRLCLGHVKFGANIFGQLLLRHFTRNVFNWGSLDGGGSIMKYPLKTSWGPSCSHPEAVKGSEGGRLGVWKWYEISLSNRVWSLFAR